MKTMIALILGFIMDIGFVILNAVLYANHPHGRGLNLFAMVWCAVMGAWVLYCIVGVAETNADITGKWWRSRW